MSLADTSNGPAYPPPSNGPFSHSTKNNHKGMDSHLDSSTRTFIELNDRNQSLDDLHSSEAGDGRGSIASLSSEVPFHEKLVPSKGKKGFGSSAAKVHVTDLEDQEVWKGRPTGIVCKTTVEQSTQRMV